MSHGGRRSGGGGPRISYTSRSAPIPINRERGGGGPSPRRHPAAQEPES
ncbi:unnamed protein product, partial [Ectocarpus sp. 8 AP-2014]